MINFYEDALPALDAMSRFEPADRHDSFDLMDFLKNELGQDHHKRQKVVKSLLADDYVTGVTGESDGMGSIMIHCAELTPKALKLLRLWPTDDAEVTFLLERVADALDSQAASAEGEEQSRLKAAGGVLRDFAVGTAAALATGGALPT